MEGSLYRKNNTCKSIITGAGGKKEFVKSRFVDVDCSVLILKFF